MDFIGYNVTFLCNGECLIARSSMRSKFKENSLIAPWACNRVHVPIIKTTPKHTHTESSLVHQIDELLQGLKVHTWNLPKHKHVHIDMAWLRHHRYDCIKKKNHISVVPLKIAQAWDGLQHTPWQRVWISLILFLYTRFGLKFLKANAKLEKVKSRSLRKVKVREL